MAMTEYIRLGSKGRLVIPKKVREKMGLESGDTLTYTINNENITFRKVPKSYTEYMQGLHQEIWQSDGKEYLEREHKSWKK